MNNNPYLNNQVQVDDEDLTVENNLLKFKDRAYSSITFSGLGKSMVRKDLRNGINLLSGNQINKEKTVYEIRYDFDLNGSTLTIPQGCILDFQGGSIKNGTIDFNKCYIKAEPRCIFPGITVEGYVLNETIYSAWFEQPGNQSDRNDIQQAIDLAFRKEIVFDTTNNTAYRKDKTTKTIFLTPDKYYIIADAIYLYQGISIDGRNARLVPKNLSDKPMICQNLNLIKDESKNNPQERFYANKHSINAQSVKPDNKDKEWYNKGVQMLWNTTYSEIKNLHFDNSKNIGISSPNAIGIKFAGYIKITNLFFSNFSKEIDSMGNYIDGITIDTITVESHSGGEAMIKIYQGDRTRIHGINGPHNINIELGQCHGGEIANCIGVGVNAYRCNALTISNMHVEKGNTNYQAHFKFNGTVATIKDSMIYERNLMDQYAIEVFTDRTNTPSIVILENVGIMRNEDSDHNVKALNDISCDKRSTIIFNMCYVDYQSMGSADGFTGLFMAPTIYDNSNKVYLDIDKINTFNGVYSEGKFREFTRELNVSFQNMIAPVNKKAATGGSFPNIGFYKYYIIPLVSASRHIGYSKGSTWVTSEVTSTSEIFNITLNFWDTNQQYINNVIRICRYNEKTGKTQCIEFIPLGRLSYSLVDMGNRIKNLGEWKDYVDPAIMEGSKCTISDKNIIAYADNISPNQLYNRFFSNGDIIESGKNTYYFNNGKWETKTLSSDSISGDLSGWVNFFSLKKGPSAWERKSVLIALSSSYNGGTTCTAIINLPYGGTSAPYIVGSGKNHSLEIKFAYSYDNEYLRIYINAGNNRCHSVKVLQSDVASSSYDVKAKAVTLPAGATVFGSI